MKRLSLLLAFAFALIFLPNGTTGSVNTMPQQPAVTTTGAASQTATQQATTTQTVASQTATQQANAPQSATPQAGIGAVADSMAQAKVAAADSVSKASTSRVSADSVAKFVLPDGARVMTFQGERVYMPVTLNDTLPATLLLDTGGAGMFVLWNDFAKAHGIKYNASKVGGDTENSNIIATKTPLTVRMGNATLDHGTVYVGARFFPDSISNGIFAPNYKNDDRVWELNFEHNFINIHQRDSIHAGEMRFPIELFGDSSANLVVEIPMAFMEESSGDTLRVAKRFVLDTGTPSSIAFFKGKSPFGDDEMPAGMSVGEVPIPDARFGLWPENAPTQLFPPDVTGTLGINFLKNFNVFIDLKNKQLMLQKFNNNP